MCVFIVEEITKLMTVLLSDVGVGVVKSSALVVSTQVNERISYFNLLTIILVVDLIIRLSY